VLSVLVMDDDDIVRRGLVRMLERAGHSATPAATAAEARALARTFDLGIMDINLGAENGIAVAREFMAAGILASVVFFSSETEPHVIAEARTLGLVAHNTAGLRAILCTL
jgi:two-component system, response regulator YesN